MSTNKERLQASITNLQNQTNIINQVGTIINTLPDRHNDIMLFKSVEEMNAYPGAVEGSIAVVYTSNMRNAVYSDKFQYISFPEMVTLPSAPSAWGGIMVQYRTVDTSNTFYVNFSLTRSRFSVSYTGATPVNYTIVYTSSDGLNYIRTEFTRGTDELENPVDFSTPLYYDGSEYGWDKLLGYFLQLTEYSFQGVYRYNGNNFELYTAQLDTTSEDAFDCIFYGENGVTQGTLQQVTNLNTAQVQLRRNIRNLYSNLSAGPLGLRDLFVNDNMTTINLADVNTSVAIDTSNMFKNCSRLTNVSNFDTSNVMNMSSMFCYCTRLTSVPNFDTANVTDMSNLFMNCFNLTSVPNFNTSNAINMYQMFRYCNNITTVPNFDISNVINMSSMFYVCSNLSDVPDWNTSRVINMRYMFSRTNIVNAPNLNFASAQNIEGIFSSCNNLINVPNFNFCNITSLVSIFEGCSNLTNIPNFDLSGVTCVSNMFGSCINLTSIPNFNTSNITNMHRLFQHCDKLTAIPNFDFSNVDDISYMFTYCNNLVNAPNIDTSNVTKMTWIYYGCRNLINVPQYNTSKITNMAYMFHYCNNLSNASIQNIINMCLNSNVTNSVLMNLNNTNIYSPFQYTNITSARYSNRLTELRNAGWSY